jgi:DNA-binding LytR/AlgR family response regulator
MNKFLFFKDNKTYTKIPYEDIEYVEAVKKYVRVVTTKKTYMVPASLCNVEKKLPDNLFCRIHRSYIVSLLHVNHFNHEIVSVNGKQFPLGRQYRSLLDEKIIVLNDDAPDEIRLFKNDFDEFMNRIKPN